MDLNKLKSQLIAHEGLKLVPYIDSLGIETIGVGHNLKANPVSFDVSTGITREQALDLLDDDITIVLDFLTNHLPWWTDLDDVRQRALIDMTFNLGGRILGFHHFLADLEAHDFSAASTEMLNSVWAQQVGQRALDLSHQIATGHD